MKCNTNHYPSDDNGIVADDRFIPAHAKLAHAYILLLQWMA
jgi:hypothetical protein